MLVLDGINYNLTVDGSRFKILDQIFLKINPSELVVITGPNGSGKSTLFKIIMGIIKPSSGKIIFNGADITNKSVDERANLGISYAFQQPVTFKGLNVYDLLNIASDEMISKKDAGRFLKQVGLNPDDYLLREVNNKLSGGELKRIEIATVLARNSDLIIFDEPEAGIDLWSFNDLTKILKELKKKKKTLIVISHQEKILKLADKIIVLENGIIKTSGKPDKILPKITGEKR